MSVNLKEADAKALIAGIDELKVQMASYMPYSVIFDVNISLFNGLISNIEIKLIVDGSFLISETDKVDNQTGNPINLKSFLKNIVFNLDFDFEFDNVKYEIPKLSA